MGSEDVTPVEVPQPSERPPAPPKNGRWKHWGAKVTKLVAAAATAAAAAYGATKPEAEGQRAQIQVEASYRELTQQVARLQRWARANRDRAKAAEAACRAEVASLQAFTSGFLLGQAGGRRSARASRGSNGGPEAVEALVKALRAQQKAAAAKVSRTKLPRLKPSAKNVKQLLDK